VFEILAREHADMLTAFLRSLVRGDELVSDLFQETMLVAWRRLPAYDASRPFGPWLRGIASNLVLEQRRKSARAMLSCEPEVLEALEMRFERLMREPGDSFRERALKVEGCMEKLPETLRSVVDMAYARGLLLRQIAESISASEEAVKKRVQRARELLLRCFQSSGVEA
jgi:RNA polymerase sigma-70 factor (ECF subfamily)